MPKHTYKPAVCVYCGAKPGANPAFAQAAREFGAGLARANIRLIYGAGDMGLMGETARACKQAGGETFGFIPRALWRREVTERNPPHAAVTEDMHQRKSLMLNNADAVVALPGGVGTLDEVIEALTWRQIGIHDKPILLLNTKDFWRPLLSLFEHFSANGFVHSSLAEHYLLCATPQDAINRLTSNFDCETNSRT